MEQGFSQPRTVAKITYVSGDRTTAILDLRNGQSVTYTPARSVDLERGDVVFIDMDDAGSQTPRSRLIILVDTPTS